MPVQTSYPGVYVQEVPSGVRTITGVSTSIALFIGRTEWGPANKPYLCFSYSDFERIFTSDTSQSDLARAVRLFFMNGGTQCYIIRIYKGKESKATFSDDTFKFIAKYAGKLGETIHIDVIKNNQDPTNKFDLKVYRKVKNSAGTEVETDIESWTGLSMSDTSPRYFLNIVKSNLVDLSKQGDAFPTANTYDLTGGKDSEKPDKDDYDSLFDNDNGVIEKEVDLFNLLIVPRDSEYNDSDVESLWGTASEFCQRNRSFLLIDPPSNWDSVQHATDNSGVSKLRQGLVKDFSAVFYPNLKIYENGSTINVGPSGAIAGLMARIDATRGVWKAPAGIEADIRGISGVEYLFTDNENGSLNQRGINVIRVFSNGIVNWGARTLDGDDDFGSEYKYIPVRRTALFIEESLYRGLKWVVFEPNDEPLWMQIRMNVNAFMHDLFIQGAFKGINPREAYFVKCDKETTTQNDINKGIVNIWVGFAPLKPAEFVILHLQQMAGKIIQ